MAPTNKKFSGLDARTGILPVKKADIPLLIKSKIKQYFFTRKSTLLKPIIMIHFI